MIVTMRGVVAAAAGLAVAATAVGFPHAATAETEPADRLQLAVPVVERSATQAPEQVGYVVSTNVEHLLALAVAGRDGHAAAEASAWALLDTLADRVEISADDPDESALEISSTPMAAVTATADLAKVALIASIYDQDPTDFGGRDLMGELVALSTGATNAEDGWLKTRAANATPAQTIDQATAVLAFAAAGRDDQAAITGAALRNTQRQAGAFPKAYTPRVSDTVSTAYAILALEAEGSTASLTAIDNAVTYLQTQQLPAGNFTGALTAKDTAVVSAALRAAGADQDADEAAAFVADLQIDQVSTGDWNGGFASGVTMRDNILNGSITDPTNANYDPTQFQKSLVPSTVKSMLAFGEPRWDTLHIDDVGTPRPLEARDATWVEGSCEGDEGVTVVIDPAYLDSDADPTIRCAFGEQTSGWATLVNAGIAVESHPGYIGEALCKLQGLPTQGFPFCWLEVTDDAGYWSYWHASPGETAWTYSEWGAGNRAPVLGGVEGWRFLDLTPRDDIPLDIGPYFGEFDASPNPTVLGTAELGQTLSVDLGQWTPQPEQVLYQWLRDGVPIDEATDPSHHLGQDDLGARISVRVRAISADRESANRTSSQTEPVTAQEYDVIGIPSLSAAPRVGMPVAAEVGDWSPTPTRFDYQWLLDEQPIPGAEAATYTPVADDAGKRLSVQVQATNPGHPQVTRTSDSAEVALGRFATVKPRVTGKTKVGRTLKVKAAASSWSPRPTTVRYQWLRGSKVIAKATKATYTLTKKDRKARIRVRVTGLRDGYVTTTVLSAKTAKVK